ncbi:MAG TPA: secondary thiamine-phosphate synthase enzyme YjbQ [Bryobacteraceae bacterium]|nr:secondary thiamine-phosphate synthase enzyme YjbQ [Bryobacteraceae bacterium]
MPVFQEEIRISTRGRYDVRDITGDVARVVEASGIDAGVVNISGIGSTLGITTLEFEPGCVADLERALELIAPSGADYAHHARWGDHNGFSHVRSALMGTARSYPVMAGRIAIGTWQQIVLCDFDERPRNRQVLVTVVGEKRAA